MIVGSLGITERISPDSPNTFTSSVLHSSSLPVHGHRKPLQPISNQSGACEGRSIIQCRSPAACQPPAASAGNHFTHHRDIIKLEIMMPRIVRFPIETSSKFNSDTLCCFPKCLLQKAVVPFITFHTMFTSF